MSAGRAGLRRVKASRMRNRTSSATGGMAVTSCSVTTVTSRSKAESSELERPASSPKVASVSSYA